MAQIDDLPPLREVIRRHNLRPKNPSAKISCSISI